ncbi:methyltransferase [Thalassotalea piscium]|uniref:Ribosomal RNA small subunit methyltransferase C n=1 Tax=Thalassotalea piscium TaxID=1230533 RepID=A0A7X0TTX8_9GAMM|nr:methyltransferase [Thalassotalea piscium]MBB6543706.1 16S rRNA (guanine1207-N2)-methyltransferase [Thalassotalea piscium]
MSLTNISQLLMRNQDLLITSQPLLVNMPDDSFINELLQLNPACQLTSFDTNYAHHLAHEKKLNNKHCAIFASHYSGDIKHDLIIIYFPKSKKELLFTLAMLKPIITVTTKILIVGENNGGIKSLANIGSNIFNYCDKVDSARHCVLFDVNLTLDDKTFNLNEWFEYYTVETNQCAVKVAALPGVFSQAKLDIGTRVLLDNLPQYQSGALLDFGCGAGVIAAVIGKTFPEITLSLADVSALAIASANKTLQLNQLTGAVFATDSLSNINKPYQHVISNPPFHQGIKTHYQATETFLNGINQYISQNGSLTIVANSFLQYLPIIEKTFPHVTKLQQKDGFTIYNAVKGKRVISQKPS